MDYLLTAYPLDCSLIDIAENAQISWSTLHYNTNNIIPALVKNETLAMTRTLGRIKLYKLNEKNPLVKKLLEIGKAMVLSELRRGVSKKAIVTA